MKSLAHLVSALVVAMATLVPLSAFASDKPATEAAHRHPAHATFPIHADVLRKVVDKRVAAFRVRIDKEMGKLNLPDERRVEIRKEIDSAAAEIKKQVDKIGADGVVTKDEARELKELTDKLRTKIEKSVGHDKRAHSKRTSHKRSKST